ncbi:MAG: hypothetical protein EKK48_27325 [Candidatus Melainabacteria bacterium]|nr:MAG: hypothetical protein EKK48_27325 [Candidatus Melainabacteria bacterium]
MTAEFSHTEPDPLAGQIARAHDSVMPQYWAPPRNGVTPQLRIGKRWFNVLWLIPISVTILVISAGAAHELRALPVVSDFIARYPGQSSTTVYYSGFPVWLRVQHVLNLFLMMFIIRSGIQILADHPRLYWNKDCTPGTEWFRFQREVPRDVLWTAKDDAVTIPKWLGIPGIRHSIGLARWWHFSCDFAWLLNGVIFYGLLFASHQWQRLVPTSKEFQELYEANFVNYSLSVGGLVENTHDFSYEELLSLPKQEQTTEHFCIQGWSGIARWGGVPMTSIMDIVKPLPHARFAVFYSFGEGGEGGTYYDVHSIANMRHQLTILAYEMNGKKLPLLHGAPVRLRCENEIGFKQVKWIRSIEFVADFNSIGSGQGGYNEDHEFYGYRMPI